MEVVFVVLWLVLGRVNLRVWCDKDYDKVYDKVWVKYLVIVMLDDDQDIHRQHGTD